MKRHNRPMTQRWIAAVVSALTVMAGLVVNVTLAATAAHAVNGDGTSPFASYNMHGSDNGLAWLNEIARLAAGNAVVALQEAGAGPPLPQNESRSNFRQIRLSPTRPFHQPSTVTRVTWPGPDRRDRYVYFLQTDPRRIAGTGQDTWDGGQMNLATVTDSLADEVRVLENPDYDPNPSAPGNRYRARPLLGLRFGNVWYWNTHARGRDVQGLLGQVRDFAARDGRAWILVGDFNVDILNRNDQQAHDQTLHLHGDENLVRTGQPTYINGDRPSELDYAITHNAPPLAATIPNGAGSDHVPVYFAQRPPPVLAPAAPHTYSTVLAAPTGRVLQENPDRSIVLAEAGYNGSQTFQLFTTDALTHFLRNVDTGDCVGVAPDARRDTSAKIVATACDDPRSHWTSSHLEDDSTSANEDIGGPQRWQNVAVPGLCLTPGRAVPSAATCTDDAIQRWWDNPSSVPSTWRPSAENVRLESSFLGGRLRRSGTVANTEVYTAPTPPRSSWLYWLLFERKDYGWNLERISPNDNLVRIKSLDGDQWCLGSRNDHATDSTDAVLQSCDDDRGVDGAGQRWLAEAYPDGSIRYRNEANHLCLLAPDSDHGFAKLASCQDVPAERWNVTPP